MGDQNTDVQNTASLADAVQGIRDMHQMMQGYAQAATNLPAFQNLMERGKNAIYDPIRRGIARVDNELNEDTKLPKFKDLDIEDQKYIIDSELEDNT